MKKPTYDELADLLARSHEKLESITALYGCPFSTAIVLVECETALNAIKGQAPAKPAKKATAKGVQSVH